MPRLRTLAQIYDHLKNLDAETAMGQFVCDLFKNKFTNEDLEKGADLTDVIAVVNAVVGYAGVIIPNG